MTKQPSDHDYSVPHGNGHCDSGYHDEATRARLPHDMYDIPVDTGWAWVVAFASFLIFLTTSGYFFAISVLFLDICQTLDTTPTAVTVMMALMTLAFCVVNQVSVGLMHVVSVRLTTTTAALVNTLATVLLANIPSLPVFMLCSILKFATHGALHVPGLTMVGLHFRRKRGVATGLAILGVSLASIVCPPLIQLWRDTYGFHGSLMILAGFESHCVIATLLLRPFNAYPKKQRQQCALTRDKSQMYGAVDQDSHGPHSHSLATTGHHQATSGHHQVTSAHNQVTRGHHLIRRSVSTSSQHSDTSETRDSPSRDDHQISAPLHGTKSQAHTYDEVHLHLSDSETDAMLRTEDTSGPQAGEARTYHQIDLSNNHSLHDTDKLGVVLSSVYSLSKLAVDDSAAQPSLRSKCVSIFNTLIDISLLSNRSTLLYLLSFVLCYSFMYFAYYIPSFAKEVGLDDQSASLLVTIYGFVDIVSKLGFGMFADTHLVRPSRIVAYTSISSGVMCLFTRFYWRFWHCVVFVVAFSILGPTSYTLNTSLIVEIMGERHLGKLLAMGLMFANVVLSVTLPFQGLLIELTGSFSTALMVIGGFLVAGGLLLFLLPLLTQSRATDSHDIDIGSPPRDVASDTDDDQFPQKLP